MTCHKCGKEHTTVVCPPADFRIACGCSPAESLLSPEAAIRRGRGADDVEQWIEEVNHLREVVKGKDRFIEQMSEAYTVQTKLKEAAEIEVKRLTGILSITVSCVSSMVVKASDANDYARNIQKGLMEEMSMAARK